MSDSVQAYWDDQAAGFDAEPDHGLQRAEMREAWASLLLEYLPSAPADVIDLGCGTGTLSVLLAGAGYRVRGLDLSGAMVSAATTKAAGAHVSAAFVHGDAAEPPYEPESCDVVLSRHVLWALPDPSAALRQWCNLLRPEGRLLLVEGRWSTGSGLAADDCERLLREHRSSVTIRHVAGDQLLWGRPIDDERYLAFSPR